MPPAADFECGAFLHFRPYPTAFRCALRQRGGKVDHGERGGGRGDFTAPRHHFTDQILEEPQFERERPLGGAGDLALQLGQLRRRVAHRAGHRLAVDELGAELRRVRGRDLDVIADHVVVADAQRGDPRRLGVARLQGGDGPAALVAQFAQFVELGRVATGDKPAVAGEERQFGGEGAAEALDQRSMLAEALLGFGESVGQGHQPRRGQLGPQRSGLAERVAQRGEVARSATAEAEASERALDIGAAAQPLAQTGAGVGPVEEELHCIEPRRDCRGVGQRCGEVLREEACAGAGLSPIDRGEKAAATLAGEGRGQLQIAPGGGVDLHDRLRRDLLRRRQIRGASLLGQRDVVHKRASGGDLGPAKAAEPVERLDAVETLEPAARGLAVEARVGERGQRRFPIGEDLEQRRPGQ